METQILQADAKSIEIAAALLGSGHLVALPTETVYGLAADACNEIAVAKIFEVKQRPEFNPLIAHVIDYEAAKELVKMTPLAKELMAAFWPGALTLVLQRKENCPVAKLASAGLSTLAIRAPKGEVARAVLQKLGRPFVAPSANPSGRLSPTKANHVADMLAGKIPLILDDGPCRIGVESTIIRADGERPILLRAGGLSVEDIETVTGPLIDGTAPSSDKSGIGKELPHAPGALASHYAPQAPLRLNALNAEPDEGLLGFGNIKGDMNLSAKGDLTEAAANLFSCLHEMDQRFAKIAVARIPEVHLGRAINDRLTRAAHKD